ncbi:heat shock protein GrpE [Tsuneonella dongtanensis]|uniref:Protein GrpE n=1 Tax=Tsuneonella dongtanensis TaxID=692370 RepID=A0A1B2AFJ8_9SPHN|nr:nucleotide exchange factor GrpE [Tsuneonella dongtanensis]ANY20868.1 heat shock protein GrpE [Tsuneonella dongtanensis]
MIEDEKQAAEEAKAKELDGVPADMIDDPEGAEAQDGLSDALAALKNDLDKAMQDVLYARAETQNVRRRMEKDVADARAYAATGFARDILSVYDNLVRAIDAIPADLHDDPRMKAMVTGIEATQREVEKVFAAHGITRIASTGLPLDPNQHQAMLEIPSDEHEPGTVVQEMQSGWMIKDRLLRPAMVGVAKKP